MLFGSSGKRPGAPGVEDPSAELDAGDRQGDGAGREDHVLGLVDVVADLDVAVGGDRALAGDLVDLVVLEEPGDAAGQGLADLLAAFVDLRPVDRHVLGDDAELGPVLRLLVDLGGAQQRLGRDAGVVQAAATGLVLFDHRGLQPQLSRADGGVVAPGPEPTTITSYEESAMAATLRQRLRPHIARLSGCCVPRAQASESAPAP